MKQVLLKFFLPVCIGIIASCGSKEDNAKNNDTTETEKRGTVKVFHPKELTKAIQAIHDLQEAQDPSAITIPSFVTISPDLLDYLNTIKAEGGLSSIRIYYGAENDTLMPIIVAVDGSSNESYASVEGKEDRWVQDIGNICPDHCSNIERDANSLFLRYVYHPNLNEADALQRWNQKLHRNDNQIHPQPTDAPLD